MLGGDEAKIAQLDADFLTPIAKGYATDMGTESASLGVANSWRYGVY